MEPCIIFGIFNISKTVASYLGLIESVDKSVKKTSASTILSRSIFFRASKEYQK